MFAFAFASTNLDVCHVLCFSAQVNFFMTNMRLQCLMLEVLSLIIQMNNSFVEVA